VEPAKGVATLAESPAAGKEGISHWALVIGQWKRFGLFNG